MCGQIWSQLYHPPNFFNNLSVDEERSLELPSIAGCTGVPSIIITPFDEAVKYRFPRLRMSTGRDGKR